MGSGETGSLTLVATPIGNLDDFSPRAAEALTAADAWLVEDTRISGKLAAKLGIKKPMRLLTDQTADSQIAKFVHELKDGASYAVITDGGCPVVSDPGAKLADQCHDAGIAVHVVPGPSAVTTALAASGFFGQRFVFLGFLGRKPGAIRSELAAFADSPLTIILFENILRLDGLLSAAAEALDTRRIALCRELTKAHEQVWRGTLGDLPSADEFPRKGELTIVIEGRRSERTAGAAKLSDSRPKRSSHRRSSEGKR